MLALNINTPDTSPRRLETGFAGAPIAITDTGTLYWLQFDFGWTGVAMDIAGKVGDEFSGYGVTWLGPDKLTFVRGADVIVRRLDSRREEAYTHAALSALGPRVLGDTGAAVMYVPSYGDEGRVGGGFYRLDLTGGAFKRLFSRDDAGRVRSSVSAISPDNRTLYLGAVTGTPSRWSSVVAVDVQSGLERPALALPNSVPPLQGVAVSPDGTTLALHASDGRIFTGRLQNGEVREVVGPAPGGGWPEVVQWSRDGQYIVYGTRSGSTSTDWRLMRVRSTGGVPEPIGVESARFSKPGRLISFALSPENGRVALTVRREPRFDLGAASGTVSRLRNQ